MSLTILGTQGMEQGPKPDLCPDTKGEDSRPRELPSRGSESDFLLCSTRLEKEKWTQDLNAAIQAAKSVGDTSPVLLGGPVCTRIPSKF